MTELSRRAMRPVHGTVVTAVLVAAAACGTGGGGVTDAGPAPTRAPESEPGPGAGAGPSTTVAGGGVATVTAPVSVYFVKGGSLQVVTRSVPKVSRIGAETMRALLAGPTAAESRAGLATAIPSGTRFLGLNIDNGVARVELSPEFEAPAPGGQALRLAQIACTLDQFESVGGVRFVIDGELVGVLVDGGAVVDRPVTCGSYASLLKPAPSSAPAAVPASGIWPFTNGAEADAAAARGERTFADPAATAREFAARYLGMADPVVFPFAASEPGAGEVGVGFRYTEGRAPVADPRVTTNVIVRQLGRQGPGGVWTVTAASAPNIEVQAPGPLERVSSPARLAGRASAFEGHIDVVVREDGMLSGASLGQSFVTGRGDGELGPFSGQVAFRPPSRPGGAVLFFDRSAADGQVLAATVVRVVF